MSMNAAVRIDDDPEDRRRVSQIELLAAIWRELERQGFGDVNPRQLNATIEAANSIKDEFERPHRPARAGMGLTAWLASDETGRSSVTMADRLGRLVPHAAGYFPPHVPERDYPHDPGDLGRCVGLLDACPALREHLPEMAEEGPEWAALVAHWAELEALYRAEAPSGQAPRCDTRMRELLDAIPPQPEGDTPR